MVFPSSHRAPGSSASTPYDIQTESFQWEDKHMYWARAMGRLVAKDEDVFIRFVAMRELQRFSPHDDRRTGQYPFVPKWLHAYWDVCSEQGIYVDGGERRAVTTKGEDIAVGKRLLKDEAFRKAFEVIYDEGGIPALVDIFAKVYCEEM